MTAQPHLLLVEDDPKLAELLSQYLNRQGFNLTWLEEGLHADAQILKHNPDLVILDLMLPGKDGLSICREIRSQYQGKILILTASDDDMDQVAALELGADDFVVKPIQPRVLLARIRMLLRRESSTPQEPQSDNHKRIGALALNKTLQTCELDGQSVSLTPSEFDLLWFMTQHQNQALSRDTLLQSLRGIDYDGLDRTVDNKIVTLRKKLGDDPTNPRRLVTVRGKGYLFASESW